MHGSYVFPVSHAKNSSFINSSVRKAAYHHRKGPFSSFLSTTFESAVNFKGVGFSSKIAFFGRILF